MSDNVLDKIAGAAPWRWIGWGAVVVLLLIPFIAMRFTSEVNWTVGDFVFAGLALGMVGLLAELTVSVSRDWSYRIGVGLIVAACFFTLWLTGAVGIIGSEDNELNQIYLIMIGLVMIGAVLAAGKPMRLAHVAGFGAGSEVVIAAVAFAHGYNVIPISLFFVAVWLAASLQLRKAAREEQ